MKLGENSGIAAGGHTAQLRPEMTATGPCARSREMKRVQLSSGSIKIILAIEVARPHLTNSARRLAKPPGCIRVILSTIGRFHAG